MVPRINSAGEIMRYIVGLLVLFRSLLCADEYIFPLGSLGSIHYVFDNKTLLHIDRFSSSEELMYRHSYKYDLDGKLISESLIGDLGEVVYSQSGIIKSPYYTEICEYDDRHNLIRHIQDGMIRDYIYNDLNELILEENSNESSEYDSAGNMIRKGGIHLFYDQNHQLVKASSSGYDIIYTYDNLGRRTSKTINGEKEVYGHFGINEISIVDGNSEIKELRIPGLSFHKDVLRPIAIETKDAIYAPIHDIQGNIVKLVNIDTKEVISLDLSDPFGRGLAKNSPTSWIFSGKYYDKEIDLVYFGHRYYSPSQKRWLSPDPACQTSDLYQYCFNNPLSYFDPDGQNAEKAQEHFDNASEALKAALVHSAAVAAMIDFPPLALYEGYEAVKNWIEWSKEYNAGCREIEIDTDKNQK